MLGSQPLVTCLSDADTGQKINFSIIKNQKSYLADVPQGAFSGERPQSPSIWI